MPAKNRLWSGGCAPWIGTCTAGTTKAPDASARSCRIPSPVKGVLTLPCAEAMVPQHLPRMPLPQPGWEKRGRLRSDENHVGNDLEQQRWRDDIDGSKKGAHQCDHEEQRKRCSSGGWMGWCPTESHLPVAFEPPHRPWTHARYGLGQSTQHLLASHEAEVPNVPKMEYWGPHTPEQLTQQLQNPATCDPLQIEPWVLQQIRSMRLKVQMWSVLLWLSIPVRPT